MKLPNPFRSRKTISAAADPARPPLGELGFSGLQAFAGLISEEYNPKLSGGLALDVYDQMRRSDAQVQAVELVISLPIVAATRAAARAADRGDFSLFVQPAGDGAADQEAAELVATNLISGMSMPFEELVRQALGAVMTGFSLHEQVWEERDGQIMLRKLPARHPRTIERWLFDDEGGLAGITQQGTDTGGNVHSDEIPIERLLLFTWRREFGNPEGRGLCRAMYKHWYAKDFLYKVAHIGLERFWMGVPKGTLPPGFNDEDKRSFLATLKKLRGGEESGLVLPPGYDVALLEGVARSGSDIIMGVIEHHDIAIARAALAQFISLGSTETGARALAEPMIELFLVADNALAWWFCEQLNRYVVPRLCQFNWPGLTQFPKIHLPDVGRFINRSGLGDALLKLTQGALVTPDRDVENTVRDLYDLPQLAEDAEVGPPPEPDTTPPESPDEDPGVPGRRRPRAPVGAASAATDPLLSSRGSAATEGPVLSAAGAHPPTDAIRSQLDASESALEADLRAELSRQLAEWVATIRPQLAGAVRSPQARRRLLTALNALEFTRLPAYRRLLRRHLVEIATSGVEAAAQALGRPSDPKTILADLAPTLDSQAGALAQKHAQDVLFAVRTQVARDLDAGLPADQIAWNVEQAARERASLNFGASLAEAADHLAQILVDGASPEGSASDL